MTKKRLRIKKLPLLIAVLIIIPVFTIAMLSRLSYEDEPIVDDYVNEEVNDTTLPVINEEPKPINPYTDSNVKVGKTYYDYKGSEEEQVSSILKHDDTYIQNTGIDYTSEKEFEVIAVMDGTVSNIKEDETLGKTIELKHNDGYISIYQSLSSVSVKKGDIISQGQVIGKSGSNDLEKDLGNHLHFEIYNNGQSINPNYYLKQNDTKKEN